MIARSTLLPGVDFNNTYLYTQGNGTLSGRFVANNGVHEYLDQGVVQQSMGLGLVADYRRARAAEALTRAQAEVAARGLVVTVVQAYYGLQAAEAKATSTQAAADEAQNFLKLSRELEQGGEVAHSDVIKAEIQANDQQRVLQDTKLAAANARLTLAVLLFPNFFQDFTLADNLSASTPLPPMSEVQAKAQKNNPELAAAFSSLEVANNELTIARAGHLPTLVLELLLRNRRQPFGDNERRPPQFGLCGVCDLEYSRVALGGDREQGEAGGAAAATRAS